MMGWSGVDAKRDGLTVTDPIGDARNHGGVTGPGWSDGGVNGVDVEKETEMSWNTRNWRCHVGLTSPRGAGQSRDGTTCPVPWASSLSCERSVVT